MLAVSAQLLTSSYGGADRPDLRRDNGQAWATRLVRTEECFKKPIRMSIASFERLYDRVRPCLRRAGDGLVGRPPTVPPRTRLLVVLFWLAHGGPQFITCEVADMAESTFSSILREVLAALIRGLPPLRFPTSLSAQQTNAADFVSRLGCCLAGVVGVIDGSLIRIRTPPAVWRVAYNTRKCFYGVLLLAVVDSHKRFLWILADLRGSLGDSRASKESAWYERQTTPGCQILHPGHILLSDGGFALEHWLFNPYPADQLPAADEHTPKRKFYNFCVTSPRAVVENAFGLLKGRWRILHDKVSAETELVPSIVESCVLLHNFLLDEGDEWGEAVDRQDADGPMTFQMWA